MKFINEDAQNKLWKTIAFFRLPYRPEDFSSFVISISFFEKAGPFKMRFKILISVDNKKLVSVILPDGFNYEYLFQIWGLPTTMIDQCDNLTIKAQGDRVEWSGGGYQLDGFSPEAVGPRDNLTLQPDGKWPRWSGCGTLLAQVAK